MNDDLPPLASPLAPLPPASAPETTSQVLSRTWVDCLKIIRNAPDTAQAWAASGVSHLQTSFGTLRLFSSTRIESAVENPAQDETHYFLIPSPNGYMLAERRRLPDGFGTVNSLPIVRIFHVHDPAGVSQLEAALLTVLVKDKHSNPGLDADIAKRLEAIGEEIDNQSSLVTGGLVMLGSTIAIANPILGMSIAAKALLPGLGSKLTKLGLNVAADSVRQLGHSWREQSAHKEAKKDIKRLKPQIFLDPVLMFINDLVTRGKDADPQMSELEHLPQWWRHLDQRLTMSVVTDVLQAQNPWPTWLNAVRQQLKQLPPS
jgi:hypothetical protein